MNNNGSKSSSKFIDLNFLEHKCLYIPRNNKSVVKLYFMKYVNKYIMCS